MMRSELASIAEATTTIRRFYSYKNKLLATDVDLLLSQDMDELLESTTSTLLKPNVQRYRPCRVEAGLDFKVHIVNDKF